MTSLTNNNNGNTAKLLNETTECPNHKYYWACVALKIPFDEVFLFE